MYHKQRWTLEKIRQRLELIAPFCHARTIPIRSFRYRELDGPLASPPVAPGFDDSAWIEVGAGDYWGYWMQDFVLRSEFTVPEDWDPSLPLALYLPLGDAGDFSHPEALAYVDGLPFAACDRHHQEITLPGSYRDGRPHALALHGWTGLGGMASGDVFTKLYMRQCSVVQIHQPTREFLALARVMHGTAAKLDDSHPARHGLLNALNAAFTLLETRATEREAFYASVEQAAHALRRGLAQSGAPLDVVIHATGHAHIDVAWLWTVGQTHRKAERTFYNVVRLMEQFEDYHFSQSQPQLYEFIRRDHPDLFAVIQQRIVEGRWEALGGMWVEADCNLSGAESLARQFLLGRSYFRQHFGRAAESPVLWLPDVFGYAWALPQLIKQAGLKYFMTIKIGWSQYNRLPYDTFLWQGLDGTRILTHFSTVMELDSPYFATYNSMANPTEALGAWQNFQQKELHRELLMSYGFGDGGGGPTREMLENIAVMGDMPGLPQVRHSSVKDFFEAIEPQVNSRMMPVWDGELYLEYHRGTYTTQARTKRANRRSEFLLHDAEFLSSAASLLDAQYSYPAAAYTEAWRTVCLNQFHDIIPGSSIGPVYEEAQAEYARLAELVIGQRDQALACISTCLGGDLVLVNPAPLARTDLAFIPGGVAGIPAVSGKPLPVQPVEGGILLDPGELQPYSIIPLSLLPGGQAAAMPVAPLEDWDRTLENEHLLVVFSDAGDLVRILDKRSGREVLRPGSLGNQFQAFEDRPKDFDAWDIDIYYDDRTYAAEPATSMRLVESGPLRWTVEIKRRIFTSQIVQRISLRHNSARLDFDTRVDWHEKHVMLKVAFPVDVLAPAATYEIQWGNVTRPTHRNTSWDWARFETCAHKWVDLSEGDYGVSLLNDCKYGHDIHANVIRLTLLRSPALPDPMADLGEHHFTYSLYPHAGGWDERTQAEAYALNDPIIVHVPGAHGRSQQAAPPAALQFVAASSPNVIVETIKRAEDGEGWILRMFESQRKRGPVTLRFHAPVLAAWETNLLEENESPLETRDNTLSTFLRPYQIMTVRVVC